jgi:hypothetical protein
VLADANPAILALPTASTLSLDEAGSGQAAGPTAQALGEQAREAEEQRAGAGRWRAPGAGPAGGEQGRRRGGGGPPGASPSGGGRGPQPPPRPPRPARRGSPEPVSWRSMKGRPPPNLGPPPEPLDWREDRGE